MSQVDDLQRMSSVISNAVAKLDARVRFRAQNCLEGFQRAERLLGEDPAMASFRALTAEEEAAAALFRVLQLRGYDGADKLNLYDHRQKVAVAPFIAGMRTTLSPHGDLQITGILDANICSLLVESGQATFEEGSADSRHFARLFQAD